MLSKMRKERMYRKLEAFSKSLNLSPRSGEGSARRQEISDALKVAYWVLKFGTSKISLISVRFLPFLVLFFFSSTSG